MKKNKPLLAWIVAILTTLAGAAVISGAGWAVLHYSLGGAGGFSGSVARLSFDIPSFFRNIATPEVCLVFMDENAGRALDQKGGIWERKVHAQLVRRLTEAGARAVFFDLVFFDQAPDPAHDEEFAAAMKDHGTVFIGGLLDVRFTRDGEEESVKVFPPVKVLRAGAAGWGLLAFRPIDPDWGVRFLYTGTERYPSSTWALAKTLGAPLPDSPQERALERWINYYGPTSSFAEMGYERALAPDGVPPGFFKDKIVFVGGRSAAGTLGLGKDDFFHPHTRKTRQYVPGVVIHATAFLNLYRGDWLVRVDERWEDAAVLGFGLLLALILPRLPPIRTTLLALVLAAGVAAFAIWLTWEKRLWFAWTVPVLVQTPIALGWAITSRYLLEERRRGRLRKAFGHYLSEDMADRIADENFDLAPGGKLVEATVLFTDLQGFTSLSENLGNAHKLSEVLIAYFTNTTEHVLENKGTLIKYIGDAVLAVWGAPLPDPDHMYKATLAAWRMHEASEKEVLGHKLVTRVGVNTGEVLAGNLGSAIRFDYTVIGDAVNFASRLEALNKYLGTHILVSETTAKGLNGRFATRRLGDFRVVGKEQAVGIHELLGPAPLPEALPWLEPFAAGVAVFCRGDLDAAERQFREVEEVRGGHDGPSAFYLKTIADLRTDGLPEGWTGAIELTSK